MHEYQLFHWPKCYTLVFTLEGYDTLFFDLNKLHIIYMKHSNNIEECATNL